MYYVKDIKIKTETIRILQTDIIDGVNAARSGGNDNEEVNMERIRRNNHKMQTGMEIEEDFPFGTQYKEISGYEGREVLAHWHTELEAIVVVDGEMAYVGEAYEGVLKKGEGILVNGNVLHSYRQLGIKKCKYLVINFHPSLVGFYEEGRMYKKYVYPYFMGRKAFTEIRFSKDIAWQDQMIAMLFGLEQVWIKQKAELEFDIQIMLLKIWKLLYENELRNRPDQPEKDAGAERVYQAVKYIREHTADKIYLSDIADACNTSSTECCRIFKKQVGQSPMEYVMKYRIKKSLEYLADDNLSIMQVAENVGFDSHSYYTKIFRSIMKLTPKEYRKYRREE